MNFGGPTEGLANLARAQAARGDDVTVMPCRHTEGPQTLETGRDANLHVVEPVTHATLLWPDRRVRARVRELARDRDIIHIHGTWRYHLLAASAAAREFAIPYVIRPAGNLGRVSRSAKALRKWLYLRLVERRAFNEASAIHCTSLKELHEMQGLPLRLRRCFIVSQPLPPPADAPSDEGALRAICPEVRPDEKLVLFLGRICAVKNLPVLLEAFIRVSPRFPDWRLVLAGVHEDARLVEALRARATEAGVRERVSLPGMVRGPAKTALYAHAQIFAQPSKHENFGLSVAEALQHGLPCVTSDGVALAEDIAELGAGVMCPSTAEAFAEHLEALMGSPQRRAACALAARSLARSFAPAAVAEALDLEYRICAGREALPPVGAGKG